MVHKLYHCWDCGTRVIDQVGNMLKPAPVLEQLRFTLSNGAYMVNPFCQACAARPWDEIRLAEFRDAIIRVMPSFGEVTIKRCDGPVSLIPGVVH